MRWNPYLRFGNEEVEDKKLIPSKKKNTKEMKCRKDTESEEIEEEHNASLHFIAVSSLNSTQLPPHSLYFLN